MKKGYIFSALLGGAFFAIPYIGLGIGIVPSVAIGGAAFAAGSLIFKNTSGKEEYVYNLEENTKIVIRRS